MKHFADPRKNLLNEFIRDYQTIGAQIRPDKNASLLKLLSLGKVRNTAYLNSFLSNFGDRYQSYNPG